MLILVLYADLISVYQAWLHACYKLWITSESKQYLYRSLTKSHKFIQSTKDMWPTHLRGGEWYPENSGSRKFLFRSRNLTVVLNESWNLILLCFFVSQILSIFAARSQSLATSWVFKAWFIRRISAVSNAIETIDNEMICFIIYCLNRLVSNCAATKEQSRGSGE